MAMTSGSSGICGCRPMSPQSIVVLVHGGFWRKIYGLDLMDPLAADLVGRGVAAWNIEYRRVGHARWRLAGNADRRRRGHRPTAAIGTDHRLDVDGVSVVGHSAGGHLALWLASRPCCRRVPPAAIRS